MTKSSNQRKQKMAQYLEQLDEFNWHHPTRVKEMADSQHERETRTYYLAQVSLILFNNYQQSYMQIADMLKLSSRTVHKYIHNNHQDFENLDELREALSDGEDW